MHPENLTAIASADADAPGLEQPDGEQPAITGLAEADKALGDPPPHAANPSTTATRVASGGADRQRRRPLLDAGVDSGSALGRRSFTATSIRRLPTCCQPTYRCRQPEGHNTTSTFVHLGRESRPTPPSRGRLRRDGLPSMPRARRAGCGRAGRMQVRPREALASRTTSASSSRAFGSRSCGRCGARRSIVTRMSSVICVSWRRARPATLWG